MLLPTDPGRCAWRAAVERVRIEAAEDQPLDAFARGKLDVEHAARRFIERRDQVGALGIRQLEFARHPLAKRCAHLQSRPVQRPIVAVRQIAHRRNALLRAIDSHVP